MPLRVPLDSVVVAAVVVVVLVVVVVVVVVGVLARTRGFNSRGTSNKPINILRRIEHQLPTLGSGVHPGSVFARTMLFVASFNSSPLLSSPSVYALSLIHI